MLLLGDIVRRHARTRPEKTAYIVGSHRLTYAVFHQCSNQLARALQRLGVGRGDRVAVLANNRPEYPIIYFGAIKLGAIVVPVNARFTNDEVVAVVTHSEATTFFVAGEFAGLVSELRAAGRLPCVRRIISLDATTQERAEDDELQFDRLTAAEPIDDIETVIDEHDPHVMLYTSGTTGSPKGTLLSQRSYYLQATTSHLQLGLNEDDIALSMFPMFHMGGWALPLGFWHTGATVVIMPKADPRAMLETIGREH